MTRKDSRISHLSSNNAYVYGNTVRKLAVQEPVVRPQKKETRRNEEEKRQELQHRQELQRLHKRNVLYTAAVTCVVAFVFVVCIQYLELQASVKNDATEIAAMEQQLSLLTLQNDEDEVKINGNIDYDAILDTAINELGMVYPNKKQVVEYRSGESEYVKQFKDIPSAK